MGAFSPLTGVLEDRAILLLAPENLINTTYTFPDKNRVQFHLHGPFTVVKRTIDGHQELMVEAYAAPVYHVVPEHVYQEPEEHGYQEIDEPVYQEIDEPGNENI
uniref:Uncharacterized protein n=1 Tax=Panagrolaimus sp. PS1159 TaxID=55785 RepID=A0AC35EW94_9BILA